MTTDLPAELRYYAEDPMWDAHAEVPKSLLWRTLKYIEELEKALKAHNDQ